MHGHDRTLLNFCANNYLGLSAHPTLVDAAKAAMDSHGAGLSSVRFICGTQNIHRRLERAIARFHGRPDAILYAACFDANAGLFEALTTEKDAILSDELNHASIIDGVRLSKARRLRYKHLDMDDLEKQLVSAQGEENDIMIFKWNLHKIDRLPTKNHCHGRSFLNGWRFGAKILFLI